MIIHSLKEAISHFISRMRIYNNIESIFPLEDILGIGQISKVFRINDEIYFVFFKRDWFHNFSFMFKGRTANEGWGQTFNMKAINHALNKYEQSFLIAVMKDGSIYQVLTKDAANYISTKDTIRIPSTEIGEEGSIPASMLHRILR